VDAAEAVGATVRTRPTGVTIGQPGEQLGIGGLPAIPLRLKATAGTGDLSYTASGLPPGLRMDPSSGWVTGVLTPGSGRYKVTVTVRDSRTGSARTTFFWNVWSF
jgi:hypothetical protein